LSITQRLGKKTIYGWRLTNLTSRNFYNLLKIKAFFKLIFLTQTWNNGMMEYWNDDLKKMTFLYLIPVKKNFTITQTSIFPEPDTPVSQYSNIFPLYSGMSEAN
jgi:hypothetical protein